MKNELKTIMLTPPYGGQGMGKVGDEADAYAKVPLIYRALQIRCDSLVRVPWYVYRGDEVVEEGWPFEQTLPFKRFLWYSEASILLKGAAYWLKNSNDFGFFQELQYLNPFTVYSNYVRKSTQPIGELQFWQQMDTGERFPKTGNWTAEDFLYLREFHPRDDIGPGVSAVQVALNDARVIGSVSKFIGNYFTYDALPFTLVTSKSMGAGEGNRLSDMIKNKLKEIANSVWRVIGITGEDVKIQTITPELHTMDFDKIDVHAVQGVSDAFKMNQSILRSQSGANRAISDNERESFLNDTIIPRCHFFESEVNAFLRQYAEDRGEEVMRIKASPEKLPEMQVDETDRAGSLKALVEATIPLKAALDILGYDLSEDAQKLIDEAEKAKEGRAKNPPVVVQQKPSDQPPDQQMKAGARHNASDMAIIKSVHDKAEEIKQHAMSLGHEVPKPWTLSIMNTEMDRWMRKSIGNFKANGTAVVDFESTIIPQEQIEEITARLVNAGNEQEIKEVFNLNGGNHA